jgi:hypothetical protein
MCLRIRKKQRIHKSPKDLLNDRRGRNIVETIPHEKRLGEALDSLTHPRQLAATTASSKFSRLHPRRLSSHSNRKEAEKIEINQTGGRGCFFRD